MTSSLRVVGAGGVGLAVTVSGPTDAPVWLHGHGAGSSGRFVQGAFAAPIHEAGWRLATWDLRGHGDSDPVNDVAGHAIESHVADLLAVADAVGPQVLGGVSLGGHAAVLAAPILRPLGVVACLPAWTGVGRLGEGPHAAVAAQVAAQGIEAMTAALRADTSMAGWLRNTVVGDFERCDARSLAAALTALDGGRAPDAADLTALPCPLALVAWPDDPGHPIDVAEHWAEVTGAPLATLRIHDLDTDPVAMGRAAVRAAHAAGITPAATRG